MKKLISLILAALLVCGAFLTGSFAEEGSMYRYKVKEDGTAEITGVDEKCKDGNIPAEIDGYKVTSIGEMAFDGCKNLKAITVPEGVTSLGDLAFNWCPALETLSLPDSLEEMGYSAISACPKLKSIQVSPDHPVYVFSNKALIDKRDMSLVRFADAKGGAYEVAWGITEIRPWAFEAAKVTSVSLPGSVTRIGSSAFINCAALAEISLPNSLKEIENDAFLSCNRLKSVTVPAGVTSIGSSVFGYCPAMTSVQVSPDNELFEAAGPFVISKTSKQVIAVAGGISGSCEIPDGVKSIAPYAFDGCSKLRELILPESVKTIGENAFQYCGNNLVIKAPAGSYAQKYCENNNLKFVELK